ncbi:MAG: TonB-dependent receptor [Lysobacteraceae bacterium]|nr:MAG: TonB-dependent receptor [Xanthomonadaceae bacterium]
MNHDRRRQQSRLNRNLLSCALASCLICATPFAIAQSTSATLRGQVAAEAKVTATNAATGLTRSVEAGANGNYTLTGLPPGAYQITVESGGQTSSRDLVLRVGETVTFDTEDATGTAGNVDELDTIVVNATVLKEAKTSEVATYVSTRQIESLPQASRNFLAFADTVPGMIFESSEDSSSKLRSGAQNSNGINVFIDGVGQKNYVLKGGISGQDSSSGNPFPQFAIGEYKVISSNYKAEYDQISSAAISAVTRSGGNEFEGQFVWDYTSDKMRSATLREDNTGNKIPSSEQQYGAFFSGPVVKDKLFFFLAYERKDLERPREIRIGDNSFDALDLTPELAAFIGAGGAPFEQDMYFGKLTWQAGDDHLVEFSVKRRDEEELTGIGNGPNTLSYGSSKTNNSTRFDARWQWSGTDWFNDMHLTSEDDAWNPRPITIGNGFQIVNTASGNSFGNPILNVGGGQDYQDKGQQGWGFQDDFTFTRFDGHTIKAGFKFKSVEINAFEQQPYNPQFRVDYYENLNAGRTTLASFIPFRVEFGAQLPGSPSRNITSTNKQYGIYLQDDWEVNDKLTLNLGLRYDYERSPGFENYRTPANLVTALRGWSNIHGPNVDYDIEDYISDGGNRKAFDGAWQPRLGFSYDLFADERHVIFGGAGRSYDRNLFDYLALEQSKSTFPRYTFLFNTPDHPCTVGVGNCLAWNSSYLNQANLLALVAANPNFGAEVNLINNDIKTPHADQFSIGMRNVFQVLGNDWNTSAAFVHIRSYDGIQFSLGNRWPDGSFRNPANPGATWGNQPWGFPIPGFGTLIIADNGIETKINSLLLSLEKPFSKASPWGFTLAYTYSDAKENRNNAAAFDEHYLFDYSGAEGQPFTRSLGISKHRLVGTGIYAIGGLTFSGKLTVASPTAKESLNCHDVPSFDHCFFDPFIPGDSIGFKQFDVAVQKEWDTGAGIKFRVRGDLFNAFNWRNYTDYDTWHGGPGSPNPTFGRRSGDGTIWPPRLFKVSLGVSW